MNIGIDLRPLITSGSGGIVPLMEGLLAELFAIGQVHRFSVFTTPRYRISSALAAAAIVYEVSDGPAALDAALSLANIEVLLRAYPTDEPLAFPPAHEVTVVPDLLHADNPEWLAPEVVVRRAAAFDRAAQGGAVALLSRHALGRFAFHFPSARSTAVLIAPPADRLTAQLANPLVDGEERVPQGNFFLYPARGWAHKNHAVLFHAWARFRSRHPEYVLVLTGTGECVPDLLGANPDPSILDLGHVSDRLLAELYHRACGLVFPSLYEGFGLPILEAFHFDLPVVCGSTTALPEVGGDAVLAVDAADPDALAEGLERVATDAPLRETLAVRGRARRGAFDATAAARSLLAALENVASGPVPAEQVRVGFRAVAERLADSEADRAARLELIVSLHETAKRQQSEIDSLAAAQISEYDRLMAGPPGVLVSVVVTMGDTRGAPDRCVRAWTQEQTFPRDRLEVIVAFDGKDREALAQVERVLGPNDRIVDAPTDSESEPWAVGARYARGRWLYFSEAHSYGEPECLEEMVRYLIAEGAPGASSRSLGLGESLWARLEERVFDRVSDIRVRGDHWSKLFLRGSALESDVYRRIGGLQGEYGRFAEPLLAARLHRAGYRLGHARRSIVRHWNTSTYAQLEEHVWDYAACECAFRVTDPDPAWDEYFGISNEWARGGRIDPVLARMEARVRLRSLVRGRGSVRALAELLPASLLGAGRWLWPAALRRFARRVRVHLMKSGESRTNVYGNLWHQIATDARLDFLAHVGNRAGYARPALAIDEVPAPHLVGFHLLEQYGGRPLRWTEPVAHLKLAIAPTARFVELVTRELRPALSLEAFVNGRRAKVEDRAAEAGVIRITIRPDDRRDGLQYLTLTCRPWNAAGDPRELGLPIFGIRCADASSTAIAAPRAA